MRQLTITRDGTEITVEFLDGKKKPVAITMDEAQLTALIATLELVRKSQISSLSIGLGE